MRGERALESRRRAARREARVSAGAGARIRQALARFDWRVRAVPRGDHERSPRRQCHGTHTWSQVEREDAWCALRHNLPALQPVREAGKPEAHTEEGVTTGEWCRDDNLGSDERAPDARGVRCIAGYRFLLDRKSTRLNSSHITISYAVFCLKKKIT